MTVFDGLFPMGIGTNRLPIKGPGDREGLEYSAALLASALEQGASYIDVSHSYSRGMAQAACKLAFERTKATPNLTVKSSFLMDQTADDALRRTEAAFVNLGISHASYFVVWNIESYGQFEAIMKKGALYDGAVQAKERGLVDHICFSTHAPPEDILRILDSRAFEAATVSFSVLNSDIVRPVLDRALERDTGVVVMNPLGGGMIPQNGAYYSFLRNQSGESTVQAALRYVSAHPAVKIVLSGIGSHEELKENIGAFRGAETEACRERIRRVDNSFHSLGGFCTGCRYCDGCPKGIPVFELMQAYNTLLLPGPKELYHRADARILENIGVCSRLKNTFAFLPEHTENPCAGCGHCEARCTARLPIIKRLEELYGRFAETGFARAAMEARLRTVIGESRRIAFYPGGGYTAFVLSVLREAYGATEFEISVFDSNPSLWGSELAGFKVLEPGRIPEVSPEKIIVSNYNFADEICKSLEPHESLGIKVLRLHLPQDVPWVF